MCQIMESVRLSVHEQLTSAGEEILCVFEKQQRGVCCVKLVRVLVLQRLSAAAEFMCSLFQREIETLETLLERQSKLQHTAEVSPEHEERRSSSLVQEEPQHEERSSSLVQEEPQPPQIKEEQEEEADVSTLTLLHRKARCNTLSDFQPLPVCKEEVSPEEERSPSLVQEESEPPQIKQEPEELHQRPEETDRSTMTLLEVKSEDDDGDENRETEPRASTSTEHMKTQAYIQYWVPSQPTTHDHLLSSHCSESDTEDSDEWEESRVDQSAVNTPDSHETQNVEGQSLSLSNKLSLDLESSKHNHSMTSHTGKKSFSCTECGKVFNHKGHLNQHTVIHTGKKAFTCTVCGKGYSQKGYLKTHMRTHTGEKPYTCTVCGKGCSENGALKRHMRTHTGEKPFTCTVCGKGCSQMCELRTHMRTHTGERPFTCTVCGKGCSEKGVLKKHMRTHTGEKPFICNVCGKGFGQMGNLRTHMRTHTEGKKL